ncbi:hypothetical protein FKM82_019192 [Ascaphus truei]
MKRPNSTISRIRVGYMLRVLATWSADGSSPITGVWVTSVPSISMCGASAHRLRESLQSLQGFRFLDGHNLPRLLRRGHNTLFGLPLVGRVR